MKSLRLTAPLLQRTGNGFSIGEGEETVLQNSGSGGVGKRPRWELVKVEKQLLSEQPLLYVYFPEMMFIGTTANYSFHVSLIGKKNIWIHFFLSG